MGIIGDLLGFGASWLQGNQNQKIANQNLQLQRETNAMQRNMFYDSMAYNTAERQAAQSYNTSERLASQDWNAQQAVLERQWNSPEQQVQRMLAAGLNPYANGLGDVTSTSAASSSNPASISGASAPGMPSLTAPRNDYHSTIFNDALQTVAVMSQSANTRSDTQERRQSLKTKLKLLAANLKNMEEDTAGKYQNRLGAKTSDAINQILLNAAKDDYSVDRQTKILQNDVLRQQIDDLRESAALKVSQRIASDLQPYLAFEQNALKRQELANAVTIATKQLAYNYSQLAFDREVQDWNKERFDAEFEQRKKEWRQSFNMQIKRFNLDKEQAKKLLNKTEQEIQELIYGNESLDLGVAKLPSQKKVDSWLKSSTKGKIIFGNIFDWWNMLFGDE